MAPCGLNFVAVYLTYPASLHVTFTGGLPMASRMSRRAFLRHTATTGAVMIAGHTLGFGHPSDQPPDIVSITGDNYYEATVKAVELLGGMKRFVGQGSKVGLLVNGRFDKPGTYVKPQIALAVVTMLHDAGATRIISLDDAEAGYWKRASLSREHLDMVKSIRGPGDKTTVALTPGTNIKEIGIVRDYLDCDAIVNVAIFKDHEGTRFTGALKNIMGATSWLNNQKWHLGSGSLGYYSDVPHLSRCIAEGNMVRKPSLCVGDATQMIIRNGPSGPGPTKDLRTIVASTDPVAFDAFGATLLGVTPDEIQMIRIANELGVGNSRLSSLVIERQTL